MIRTNVRLVAVALAGAGVVLTACTDDKKVATPSVTTATVTAEPEVVSPSPDESFDVTLVPATPEPTDSAAAASSAATPGASASSAAATSSGPPVAPGRWFAFLKELELGGAGGEGRFVTYDEAQFLTGEAAKDAAAADKQELDSDYYIRNQNKRLRTVKLYHAADLLGSIMLTGEVELTPVSLDQLRTFVETEQAQYTGFWLTIATVEDKLQITKIEEQYTP